MPLLSRAWPPPMMKASDIHADRKYGTIRRSGLLNENTLTVIACVTFVCVVVWLRVSIDMTMFSSRCFIDSSVISKVGDVVGPE